MKKVGSRTGSRLFCAWQVSSKYFGLTGWTRQLRGEGELSDTEFVESASGEKISDCLLAVLGDLVDKVATEEEMGKLVKLASIAWNASLLPEQERADFLQSSAMQDVYVDVKNLIELLIRRKLLLFPEV
jgi:hypothetical protein